MGSHDYFFVPFSGVVAGGGSALGVTDQLQALVDHYAGHGWEFHSIAQVSYVIYPGCIGTLFGHSPTYAAMDQVVFRKPTTVPGG